MKNGFGSLATLMALVFVAVRLLPPTHPYLNPVNQGRFGVRHVFGEAWARLSFRRENTDQIIIFFALITGFLLLLLQFAVVIFSFAFRPAMAAALTGMFATAKPDKDIALMLLDSVFGIPNFFNSCVSTQSCGAGAPAETAFPTPFQTGLQAMFEYYSMAMLVVAVLIFLYYVVIVVGETAQTGTPFGRRFDHIWAPLRLIMAIGLLVPLNYGYSGGQYIALFAARLGSGFATNAWLLYNEDVQTASKGAGGDAGNAIGSSAQKPGAPNDPRLVQPPEDVNNSLVAQVPAPDVTAVMEFMTLVEACKVAYETLYPKTSLDPGIDIEPYLVKGSSDPTKLDSGSKWSDAVTFYGNHDVVIVFGDSGEPYDDTSKYSDQDSRVEPLCGEITIPTKDVTLDGVKAVSTSYFNWVLKMFANKEYLNFGIREGCMYLNVEPDSYGGTAGQCTKDNVFGTTGDYAYQDPPDVWKQQQAKAENDFMVGEVKTAYQTMLDKIDFSVTQDILDRGWGGAGIWYNQIGRWNGAFTGAVKTVPIVSRLPMLMEEVQKHREGNDPSVDPLDTYDPTQGKKPINWDPDVNKGQIAQELSFVYKYWKQSNSTTAPQNKTQGNMIIDVIHAIFGVDGLYDITRNDYVNPMVSLVVIGKSILDGAMRNLIIATTFSFASSFMQSLGVSSLALPAAATTFIAGLAMTATSLALGIGITLYYVLPFMPFLYFYFAVGNWVKSIFEAMVGVPLWALAHLKISGEGLPGGAEAMAGYYMIFEIFLRPILTVFGLLASMSIFSAMVRTLNNIFPLVTANVTGYNCSDCATAGAVVSGFNEFKRNTLDQFFFTIIYTFLVYMIGTSCFKMIDQVPDGVLRWMESGARSFAETARGEDPGEKLGEHTLIATQVVGNQVLPGIQEVASGAGAVAGSGARGLMGSIRTATDPKAGQAAIDAAKTKAAANPNGSTT